MNVIVGSIVDFTVTGKTRAGTAVLPSAGSSVTVPGAVSVVYDPATGKGSFVAPAVIGVDTFTATDGSLTPFTTSIMYVLDPNTVVALNVTFP